MTIKEAVTQRIKQLCEEKFITPNRLGSLAGIDPSTITSIFYGKSKNPGIGTLQKICKGLQIEIVDFFNHPIFKQENLE